MVLGSDRVWYKVIEMGIGYFLCSYEEVIMYIGVIVFGGMVFLGGLFEFL